jgi:Putative zinc-finger
VAVGGEAGTIGRVPGAPHSHAPSCLDEDEVLDFVDGALGAVRRDEAARHLEGCAACREL